MILVHGHKQDKGIVRMVFAFKNKIKERRKIGEVNVD
jgi:hypothetical protein